MKNTPRDVRGDVDIAGNSPIVYITADCRPWYSYVVYPSGIFDPEVEHVAHLGVN